MAKITEDNMSEPCLCGADDCKQCHPENFEGGRYVGEEEQDREPCFDYPDEDDGDDDGSYYDYCYPGR